MTQPQPGPGVDASGNPAIDPTANVLNLVDAAIRRQDDLREMESRHVRETMELRADFGRQLRDAESARIDAIRAVDVGAVQRAADVAAQQASTLAAQGVTTAEAMRVQVAATAAAASAALSAALDPIQKRIEDLSRAQYEAQGQKTQVVETQAKSGLTVAQVAMIVGVVGLIVAVIFGAATIGLALYLKG
jgi:hypothetical protein